MTRVQAIRCPSCGDLVYSRARHDFRRCSCGTVAIDGGFDYQRILYKNTMPEKVPLDVDATRDELYADWNFRRELYGLVRPGSEP